MFNKLRDATRSLLEASTPGDKLWLVTADGKVRGGTREMLIAERHSTDDSALARANEIWQTYRELGWTEPTH